MPKRPHRSTTPQPLTRSWVEARALRYLNRFDATESRLRDVLRRAVNRHPDSEINVREQAYEWVNEVVAHLATVRVVDDRRLAQNLIESFRARGASARKIVHHLVDRGIAVEVARQLLNESSLDTDGDPELTAARIFVKRRRIGSYRSLPNPNSQYSKDLAALARAGFNRDVAEQVLMESKEED